MSVYVDNARTPYRGMLMCHMVADTLDELHAMADAIGIERRWFQGDASHPHYDICQSKRAAALRRGAVEVDRAQLVAVLRRLREARAEAAARLDDLSLARADRHGPRINTRGGDSGLVMDFDIGGNPPPRRPKR